MSHHHTYNAGHLVVSKPTLQHWLRKKHSVGIVVGGEAEVLAARNNDDSLVLRGRKGFFPLFFYLFFLCLTTTTA